MSLRSTSRSCAPVDASSTSHAIERVGDLVEGDRAAPDPLRELLGRARRCGWRRRSRRRPRPPARAPCPHPCRRHRARARGGRRASRAARRPARPRPTTPTPRGGRCRSRCAPACPTSTAWRNVRESSGPLADSCSAAFHASRTWPRISPSPMIIESRPAATPKRCATAASSWYVYRRSANSSGSTPDGVGEEVAHVLHRRVEQRGVRVDLGAVARGEQHDLGEVLARRASDVRAPWAGASGAHRHALEQVDRHRAVVESDDDERHARRISLASSTRPARIRSSMPESRADCQSGSSLERPAARSSSRASDNTSNSVAYSGPISVTEAPSQPGGQGRAAPAGADGDHQIALADHRHEGERAVGGVVGRVHPDPAGLARPRTPRGRRPGSPVAVVASQASSRSAGVNGALGEGEAPGVGPGADLVADVGRDHVHVGARRRAARRSCGPRSGPRPRRRSAARRRRGSPGSRRSAGRPAAPHRAPGASPLRGSPARAGRRESRALLVEGQDLQLDGEVDLAQRHARRARSRPSARS